MHRRENWDDGNYMEWADQERIVQQEVEEINQMLRKRKAENYRETECEVKERE